MSGDILVGMFANGAAVVLAGGAGRRLGGIVKPALEVGGRPLLVRVLDAARYARPRIVVGPAGLGPLLPPDVLLTCEEPPGSGPVAGVAAAVRLIPARIAHVAVLSADLPFLTPQVLQRLRAAASGGFDAAVLVDGSGRPQWLCAVWESGALRRRLAAVGDPAGARVRDLAATVAVREVVEPAGSGPPPWFDCDTDADLRRAQEWAHADAG